MAVPPPPASFLERGRPARHYRFFVSTAWGRSIALSSIGKESGAHVNPAVTLGFWLMAPLRRQAAVGYAAAPLAGAVAGSLPLLAWGAMGQSVAFGATLPRPGYTTRTVVLGEAITTFRPGRRPVRLPPAPGRCVRFTPAMIRFLYTVMVPLEAGISTTSTNPARMRRFGCHLGTMGGLVESSGSGRSSGPSGQSWSATRWRGAIEVAKLLLLGDRASRTPAAGTAENRRPDVNAESRRLEMDRAAKAN